MQLPQRMLTRSFIVVGLTVALYAAGALAFGWDEIAERLRAVSVPVLLLVGGLSLVNYGIRFLRWELYLRTLGAAVGLRTSLVVYFAAYVMVITPGKIGEVFKAGILRENHGVSLSRGLPIVLAERLYDFLAVVVLAAVGILFWPGPLSGLGSALAVAALIPALAVLVRSPRVRQRLMTKAAGNALLARHRVGLDDALASLGDLLTFRVGTISLALSTMAWFCECLGLYLVCRGLDLPVGLGEAVFVYAAGTLVGSLSFMPGGLGGTEATIIWLLGRLSLSGSEAATAALLVRLFTLWLAVAIGVTVFLAGRKHLQAPDRFPPAP